MEAPRPLKYLVQDDRPTAPFTAVMRKHPDSTSSLDPLAPSPPPAPPLPEDDVALLPLPGAMQTSTSTPGSRHMSRHNSHDDVNARKPRPSLEVVAAPTESTIDEGSADPDPPPARSASPPLIAGSLPRAVAPPPHLPPPPRFRSFSEAKQAIQPPRPPAIPTAPPERASAADLFAKARSSSIGEHTHADLTARPPIDIRALARPQSWGNLSQAALGSMLARRSSPSMVGAAPQPHHTQYVTAAAACAVEPHCIHGLAPQQRRAEPPPPATVGCSAR